MATKIRLQRHGKKGAPYYHIVTADSRVKRDGRYIERLGFYNPNTNPATIDLDFDRTLYWTQVGAEMTDTARAILSYKGILYKNHLLNGVKKGALTEADVEKKFDQWLKEKEAKIANKSEAHAKAIAKVQSDRLAKEKEVNEARAKELAVQEAPVEEVTETPETKTTVEETEKVEETTKAEAPKEEVAPAKEEEKKTEDKAEEK